MINSEQLFLLQEAYSKENLDKGLFHLARKFFAGHPFETWEGYSGQNIISVINSKKTFTKVEMATVSFAVFQNDTILKAFLKTLPKLVYRLIEKLLFREEMDNDEISEFLQEEIINSESYYNSELKKEFYFFSVKMYRQYINYTTAQNLFVLSLHPVLKKLLVNHFPKPLYYNIIPLDEIAATDFQFTAESLIQAELPRLLSYQMQQNIKYNSSGRPADATLSKLQRVCQTTEFYATEDIEIYRMRTMLLAGLVYKYSPKTLSANNADIIKNLFNNHYFRLDSPVFVLQQLKGWQHVGGEDFFGGVEKKLQEVFRLIPTDKWISFDNFYEYFNIHSIDVKPVTISAARNYLVYQYMYYRGSIRIPERKGIENSTYDAMVKRAFIAGTAFLYAAYGLIEIAYNNLNTEVLGATYYSGYDGLQYIKLTNLGAYVLDITKKYENENAAKTNKITFDEDALIILAEGDLEVVNVMLSNYT
ncbi:MAG TPA: hypothetical protein VF623_14360, partial [Segetibacter sp.]